MYMKSQIMEAPTVLLSSLNEVSSTRNRLHTINCRSMWPNGDTLSTWYIVNNNSCSPNLEIRPYC